MNIKGGLDMTMIIAFIVGIGVGMLISKGLFNLAMSDIQKRRRSPEYNRHLFNRYYSKKY